MDKFVSTLRRIAPEIGEIVERRYIVLRNIFFMQPVGRRTLSGKLRIQERAIRNEMEFLRELGLITVRSEGTCVTEEGETLIWELKELVSELRGLSHLEKRLAEQLGLSRVYIALGDSDTDNMAKAEMARLAARYLKEAIKDGDIIAVSGGSTMAEVVNALTPWTSRMNVTVVPARGGLGEDVEIQANTIAANMAKVLGGAYRLLHVQDGLSEEATAKIVLEPKVQEVLAILKRASLLIHGVGLSEEMARRRGISAEDAGTLTTRGAVGEAFGYYFNRSGDIVYSTSSVGLRLDDLKKVDKVVAVGGGSSKGKAVLAVIKEQYHDVLITDEGAAKAILELLGVNARFNSESTEDA